MTKTWETQVQQQFREQERVKTLRPLTKKQIDAVAEEIAFDAW